MSYNNFLSTISSKFEKLFDEISVEYNFDYGPEFEVAFCKVLRIFLPTKYGVCRGFAITKDGETKGDDIIIYDQERFPTLRLLEDNTFERKQKIPIEAIYAYIEAKHTLCIEGNGGQSLTKALNQVAAVKNLPREKVPLTEIGNNITIGNLNQNRTKHWPQYRNPLYGAIIARHVRIKESALICDVNSFFTPLQEKIIGIADVSGGPDLIIAGSSALALPIVDQQIGPPFSIDGISNLAVLKSDGNAFGLGMSSMMYAFDTIILGRIHWPTLLATALNLPLNMDTK